MIIIQQSYVLRLFILRITQGDLKELFNLLMVSLLKTLQEILDSNTLNRNSCITIQFLSLMTFMVLTTPQPIWQMKLKENALFATLQPKTQQFFHAGTCACAFNALRQLECRLINALFAELTYQLSCKSRLMTKANQYKMMKANNLIFD